MGWEDRRTRDETETYIREEEKGYKKRKGYKVKERTVRRRRGTRRQVGEALVG